MDAFWVGTHATSPNSCYLTAARRCREQFFLLLVDLGLGAAVILHSPTFSSLSVFVFVFPMYLSLYSSFLSLLLSSMTFLQSFLWHPRLPTRCTVSDVNMCQGWNSGEGKRGGSICLKYQWPVWFCRLPIEDYLQWYLAYYRFRGDSKFSLLHLIRLKRHLNHAFY